MKILFASTLIIISAIPVMAADDAATKHAADFATKAALSNQFEIEAAKIEIAKGKASDARQFAQDMLVDHGKAGPLLAEAARKDGIALPSELDSEHRQKIEALQSADPENLDQAYLSTQVTAHQQAVELFDRFSKDGPDGELKKTANKILPDLHMFLLEERGGSVCLNSFGRFAKWISPRLCRHHHWCQRVEVGLIRRLRSRDECGRRLL